MENTTEDVVKSFFIVDFDENSTLCAKLIKKNRTFAKIYKVINDYKAVDIFRRTMRKKNRKRDVSMVESCDKGKKPDYYPRSPKKAMREPLRGRLDTNSCLIYDQAHIYSIIKDTFNYGCPPRSRGNSTNRDKQMLWVS